MEHRVVLYDKIGPGAHKCHWCGCTVRWYPRLQSHLRPKDYLIVDHKDSWSLNNNPNNLIPCCSSCNTSRGCKNQAIAEQLYSYQFPKKELKSRYKRVYLPNHPLAVGAGTIPQHRVILYDRIGGGPHPCHWCGKILRWTKGKTRPWSLLPDHVDGNGKNNNPGNIVPACPKCNSARRKTKPLQAGEVFTRLWNGSGQRYRCTIERCHECGDKFHRLVSSKLGHGRFCSKSCAQTNKNRARIILRPGEFLLPINSGGRNRKVAMVNCAACGMPFPRPTSDPQGTRSYCSRRCAGDSQRTALQRACERCGATFSSLPHQQRRFCSRKCAQQRPLHEVQFSCEHCGKTFTCLPCEHRKFCSHACYAIHLRTKPTMACERCGKAFVASVTRHRRFCSRLCSNKRSRIATE
jgi:hypothetical protein